MKHFNTYIALLIWMMIMPQSLFAAFSQSIQVDMNMMNQYQMRSTSSMLQSAYTQPSSPASTASVMTYMVSQNGKNRRTWTRDNLLRASDMMCSGSAYSSHVEQYGAAEASYSGPRRGPGSGGSGGTDIPEPTIQPVGDGLWVLAFLAIAFIGFKFVQSRRKKLLCQKSVNIR